MTFAYSVFGIPRTFDEFVDKAKKMGQPIDIQIKEKCTSADGGIKEYISKYRVILNSGRYALKVFDSSVSVIPSIPEISNKNLNDQRQEVMEKAGEIAKKLKESGLEVTIDGEKKGNIDENMLMVNKDGGIYKGSTISDLKA